MAGWEACARFCRQLTRTVLKLTSSGSTHSLPSILTTAGGTELAIELHVLSVAGACLCSILQGFRYINTVTRVFGSKGRMALQRIRSFAFSFVPKHWHRLILTRQLRLWVPPTSPELLPDVVKGAVRASNARGDQLFVCDCPR